jgi:hypothetical protein
VEQSAAAAASLREQAALLDRLVGRFTLPGGARSVMPLSLPAA